MPNLNKVMLMGNITRDLELKYLPSQTAVCEIGLAVNRKWTAQDGTRREETTFFDCSCFGKQAETLVKYMKKGDPLFIEGRLKLDTWEKDGQKRSKMRVIVETFQFLSRGPGGTGAPANDGGEEYSQRAPAPQAQRQPFRPQGRPAAAPAASAPPDMDQPSMDEDGPPIREDDIPF